MQRNIAAHTRAGSAMPSFISLNAQDDGSVVIMVRGEPKDGVAAATVSMTMSADEYEAFAAKIASSSRPD